MREVLTVVNPYVTRCNNRYVHNNIFVASLWFLLQTLLSTYPRVLPPYCFAVSNTEQRIGGKGACYPFPFASSRIWLRRLSLMSTQQERKQVATPCAPLIDSVTLGDRFCYNQNAVFFLSQVIPLPQPAGRICNTKVHNSQRNR